MKTYLRLDNAIVTANVKRIQEGKEIIRHKKHLAKIIAENNGGKTENIYMQIYRYENKGLLEENTELINKITSVLNVDKSLILSSI